MADVNRTIIPGEPGWKCTTVFKDGTTCNKNAYQQLKGGGFRCNWCDPPTCELCKTNPAIGWTYIHVKILGKSKKHYICKECCPWDPIDVTGDPCAYICKNDT